MYQRNQFPYGSMDTAQESGRKGSHVYELNTWLWQFGRGRPRVGGLSVADTEDRRIAVLQDRARRDHAIRTKRKHKAVAVRQPVEAGRSRYEPLRRLCDVTAGISDPADNLPHDVKQGPTIVCFRHSGYITSHITELARSDSDRPRLAS
jgi:hypothetical protein